MTAAHINDVFESEYLADNGCFQLVHHRIQEDSHKRKAVDVELDLIVDGKAVTLNGSGAGSVEAFIDAFNLPIMVMDYHEHAISSGADSKAAAYVEIRYDRGEPVYGVGVDRNIVAASLKAILSGLNRCGCDGLSSTNSIASSA